MSNDIDILQIKIGKARAALPEETLRAIDAVPWKITLLEMREKKGWSIEQLGDLELETELLLCGLISSEEYPKELEKRLHLPKAQVEVLVNEMNDLVFKKIRDVFIKNTEHKEQKEQAKESMPIAASRPAQAAATDKMETREEMLRKIENPDLTRKELPSGHPILAQKLAGSFQIQPVKTEHTLENISKPQVPTGSTPSKAPQTYAGKDPYRIAPGE